MTINQSDKQSLRDIVFKAIRDDILSEKLLPGERLMEKHLADKLGVSRTPIREALSKLEQEGFIETVPRKGATVSIVRKKDIEDVLKIRAVLEALAAKSACERINKASLQKMKEAMDNFKYAVNCQNIETMIEADIAFHDIIFSLSGNEKLTQILNNLREQIYRYRIAYLKDENYRLKILSEHDDIFNAIKNKDKHKAAEYAMIHIENQEDAVIRASR